MFFVPEAKPRDTKHTVGIITILYFNKEHNLMARSEAEGILPMNITHSYLTKYSNSIKSLSFYPLLLEIEDVTLDT